MNSKMIVWIMAVFLLGAITHAEIAIESFTANPMQLAPGQEVSLELLLQNTGDDDIENVIVSLDFAQVPFAPVGSSTEQSIDEINDHRRERMFFTLKALPSAVPLVYKIPVIITYNGQSRITFVSLEVVGAPHVNILLGEAGVLTVQEQGTITLKFVNDGLSDVTFLTVTLPPSALYDIISPSTSYIGDVDVGDFETEEFTIISHAANPILNVQVEYKDAANHIFRESTLVRLPVYSPEEAARLGLAEPKSVVFPIIIGIVILVLAILAYKKVKKRRTHES